MIASLINAIMFGLATALTAVIPMLYKVFEQLASVEVLSVDRIRNIWNNLYVLLSVLVLFAIAIKLINAIVNPDVLTDQKKGVKKVFFKAVISVFLVALVPYLFGTLQEIEHKILKDNLIQKFIFNDEGATDAGGELVWVAISSCIDLDKIDAINLEDMDLYQDENGIWRPNDPTPRSAYLFMLQLSAVRPWATLNIFSINTINQGIAVDSIFDFHPLVLFIFLVVLAYELIILVLDTALRAFKLLLLQMMTPIVLGAYVFKDDILKNWFLEYIKTFLQIFLLIIALSFMEYLIPIATNINSSEFVQSLGSSNFLFMGVVRMLLYIGVLRLVKQIGPLINKIFGTNIQPKGGIKGRLGEMAAVGGIAANAWGAIGTKAKNAGKAIGTGLKNAGKIGVQAAAGAGINALDKKYKAKYGSTLSENKFVRLAKGVGAGLKTGLKGGKLQPAIDEFRKGSAAPSYTDKQLETNQEERRKAAMSNGFDKDGNYDNYQRNPDGTIKRGADGKPLYKDNMQHKKDMDGIGREMYRTFSNIQDGDKVINSTHDKNVKDMLSRVVSGADKGLDDLYNQLNTYAGRLRQDKKTDEASRVEAIAEQLYKHGNLSSDDRNYLLGTGKGSAGLTAAERSKIEELKKYYERDIKFASILGSSNELAIEDRISVGDLMGHGTLHGTAGDLSGKVELAAKNASAAIEGMSAEAKAAKAEYDRQFNDVLSKVNASATHDPALDSLAFPIPEPSPVTPAPGPAPSPGPAPGPAPSSGPAPSPGDDDYEDYYLNHTVGSSGSGSGSSEPPVINNTTNNYNTGGDGSSSSGGSSGSGGSSDSGGSSGSKNETNKVEVTNLGDVNSTIRGAVSEITGAINSDNRSTRDSLNKAIKEMNNSVEELGDDISKQKKDDE